MAWNILYLPAIVGEGDEKQSLWPEVFPLPKLETMRLQMGTALFDCMFMGRPESLQGDIFNPRWFRSCQLAVKPDNKQQVVKYVNLAGEMVEKSFDKLVLYQFWDLAISSKETADYTCCVTVAVDSDDMDIFVLDVSKGHWSFEVTQQKIVELAHLWTPSAIGIESIAYQAAAVQVALGASLLPIREIKVDKDKVTRSRLGAARAEAGKVYILRGMSWEGGFIDELAGFPTGAHDDQVDAFSGAMALAASWTPSRFELWGDL